MGDDFSRGKSGFSSKRNYYALLQFQKREIMKDDFKDFVDNYKKDTHKVKQKKKAKIERKKNKPRKKNKQRQKIIHKMKILKQTKNKPRKKRCSACYGH